jgi:hypothetical protein
METVKIKTSDGVIIEMPRTALEYYPHLKHFLLQDNKEMPQTEIQTLSSDTKTEGMQDVAEPSEQISLHKTQQRGRKKKEIEETQQ